VPTHSIALDRALVDPHPPHGFTPPDFSAPLDEAEALARIPTEATVKGMFLAAAVEAMRARDHAPSSEETFVPFDDYPMRRAVALLFEAARAVHPGLPIREGIRRLTWSAYGTFADSLIGRVVFAAARRSPASIYRLAARAWPHGASHGRLAPEILDDRTAIVRATEFPLPEPAGIGIAEGVLLGCKRHGSVAVLREGPDALQLWIRWA
jgi:uncharacterized protein (TIGR02265 family)